MNKVVATWALGAAAAIAIGVGMASAQGKDAGKDSGKDSGQTPPEQRTETQAETPKECISDNGGFRDVGGQPVFVVELTNNCSKKIRCVIDAYITTAKGPTSGHAVLTIDGQPGTTKSYSMKIKQSSGMANTSRSCDFIR